MKGLRLLQWIFLTVIFAAFGCKAAEAQYHPPDAYQYYDSVTANSCIDAMDYAQAKINTFCAGYENCENGGADCSSMVAYGWHDGDNFSYKETVMFSSYGGPCYPQAQQCNWGRLEPKKGSLKNVAVHRSLRMHRAASTHKVALRTTHARTRVVRS